jgi:OmpA-OmpF porin, OOP family
MISSKIKIWRNFLPVFGIVLLLALASLGFGQNPSTQPTNTQVTKIRNTNIQPVPSGAKLKFKGVVIGRDADSFTIRDRSRTDYRVLLTDETSIKSRGGIFRGGKRYAVADILRGLIVEVEGRGDAQGKLVAEKVRFDESDLRAAITTDARVNPVEENQERLSGQIDELYTVAAEAKSVAGNANERITALDDFDVQESATVNFRLNSALLSLKAKQQLDSLAAKATNARGYMIEVGGYADSTGNESRNFRLSRLRADAVIQYLAVTHKIPLRRFISPMGYGETGAVANNKTASGRAQNRRVEVKILSNRGLIQSASTTPATPAITTPPPQSNKQ